MITIALDETSGFEEHDDMDSPVYIAGIIYDDGGSVLDFSNETKRLIGFFEKACESVGCRYPRDMHMGNRTNAKRVAMTKEAVKTALPEFLQRGTFQGKELINLMGKPMARTGKYYLCLILKSAGGKNDLLGDSVSVLMKDDFAGNLYVHMAEEVISRCIFHNPFISDIKHVRFDLATRRIVLQGEDRNERAEEYIRLRYPEVPVGERVARDSREFVLVNPDVYRTAIEREMMISDRMDVKIDKFSTRSISYYESAKEDMVFLHLADIICSALAYKIEGNCPKEWLVTLETRMQGLSGELQYLLFAYDTVDTYYADAWNRYEEKDYYKALSITYDGMHYDGDCSEFYRREWFPRILAALQKETDSAAYTMALHKFREAVFNNNLNQDKMLFILLGLEQMEKNIVFPSPEDRAVLYRFYDTAATVLNLSGMSEQAERYVERGKQFFRYVGVEELLRTQNKSVVAKCDQFNFRTARRNAEESLDLYERIQGVRKHLAEGAADGWVAYARALSQMGQICAFERRSEAEDFFNRALEQLEPKTPNYMITLSYLLHFYLDNGMRREYEEYANIYFNGAKSLEEKLRWLVEAGSTEKDALISLKYALYVYVRAIYVFYMDEISDKLVDGLCDIGRTLEKIVPGAAAQINGHPRQLIYKYLALIAYFKGRRTAAAAYRSASDEIFGDCDEIIKVIIHFGNAEYADLTGDTVTRDEESQRAWREILEISEEVKADDCEDVTQLYDYLKGLVTYTYR